MYKGGAANVLTVIFAVILTIVLALFGFVTATMYSLSAMFQPESIASLVTQMDVSESIVDNESVKDVLDELEIEDEVFEEIMESALVEDAVATIAGSLTDSIAGNGDGRILSDEDIEKLVNENIDEIVDIVCEASNEDINPKQLKKDIIEYTEENSKKIARELPRTDELIGELDNETTEIITFFSDGTPILICTIVSIVVALGLYFLRFKHLRGLIWVGSATLASAALLGIMTLLIDSVAGMITGSVSGEGADVANVVIDMIAGKFLISFIVMAVIAVVFMVVGIVVGNILKKKKNSAKVYYNY